jgi:flagellar biosynthesis/type III secretory pathway M-ring protein FliF/YscJ
VFDGADYVIAEIIWWMTASAVVGFLLGWILRRFFLAKRHRRRLRAAHARIEELEARLASGSEPAGAEKAPDPEPEAAEPGGDEPPEGTPVAKTEAAGRRTSSAAESGASAAEAGSSDAEG